MKINPVLAAKSSRGRTFGIWQTLGNSFVAEMFGKFGFEWVIVDMQHGSIDWHDLGPVIQGIELGGSCALVRVEANTPSLIMRALDLGAAGVIVPMISSADEARRASEAVHYPPKGNRSFGPTRSYYMLDAERPPPACILMIETRAGLDGVEAIAATPGVDGLFLGPVDLALDLGLPLSLQMHAAVLAAVDRMVAACTAAGVLSGSTSMGKDNAQDLIKRGVQLLSLGSDIGYLKKGAQEEIDFLPALK
jgi:4-hydroxy-2-oxoheptanedioate aldolase